MTGSIANDDDDGTGNDGKNVVKSHSSRKSDAEIVDMLSMAEKDSAPSDVGCILKCKSVFKCRLCPRIVCLTEESLKGHLKSKVRLHMLFSCFTWSQIGIQNPRLSNWFQQKPPSLTSAANYYNFML